MGLNTTSIRLPTKAPVTPNAFQMPSRTAPFAVCLSEDTTAYSVFACSSPPTPIPWHTRSFSTELLHKARHVFRMRKAEPSSTSAFLPTGQPDLLKQKWKTKRVLFSCSCHTFPSVFFQSYSSPIKGELDNYNNNNNVHYDKDLYCSDGDTGRKWDV